MPDVLISVPVDPNQRIHQLWCWVLVHPNGGESIAAVGSMPLLSDRHHLARDGMYRAAERVAQAMQADRPGTRVELREFEWSEPDGRG